MKDLVRAMIEDELRSSEMMTERDSSISGLRSGIGPRIVRLARIAGAMHLASESSSDRSATAPREAMP